MKYSEEEFQGLMQKGDVEELQGFVGTAIFHAIEPMFKANTGKITGMLLDRTDFQQIC